MSRRSDMNDVNEARRQAIDWFVRLKADDAAAEDWLAFERWLGDSDAHETAFREVETIWIDLDSVQPTKRTADVIPLPVRSRPVRRPWRVPAAIAASVAVLIAAAGLMTVYTEHQGALGVAGSETARIVSIPGGGVVQVAAGTPLSLQRSGTRIVAAMGPGRARFVVAHDPRRILVVEAGAQTITDIGTTFDVHSDGATLSVTVVAGEVAVSSRNPADNVLTVRAGQSLVAQGAADDARLRAVTGAPIQKVYDRARLGQVVDDLNRIYAQPVRLAPGAADIRFTGALVMQDQNLVLRRLAAFLDLEITHTPTAIVLGKAGQTAR